MQQARVIAYLFRINYMPIKHEFSDNMNWPQLSAKTTIAATSFDVN